MKRRYRIKNFCGFHVEVKYPWLPFWIDVTRTLFGHQTLEEARAEAEAHRKDYVVEELP